MATGWSPADAASLVAAAAEFDSASSALHAHAPPAPPAAPPATPPPAHVSLAHEALSRGLAALSVLGPGATEAQTAEALMLASEAIRTVAEAAGDEGGAATASPPAAPPSPPLAPLSTGGPSAWSAWRSSAGAPAPRSTTAVLQLFASLEHSEDELAAFREQAHAAAAETAAPRETHGPRDDGAFGRAQRAHSPSAARSRDAWDAPGGAATPRGAAVQQQHAGEGAEAEAPRAWTVAAYGSRPTGAPSAPVLTVWSEVEQVVRAASAQAAAAAQAGERAHAAQAAADAAAAAQVGEEAAAAQAAAEAAHATARVAAAVAAAASSGAQPGTPGGSSAAAAFPWQEAPAETRMRSRDAAAHARDWGGPVSRAASPFRGASPQPPAMQLAIAELSASARAAREEAAHLRIALEGARAEAARERTRAAALDAALLALEDAAADGPGGVGPSAAAVGRARLEAAVATERARAEALEAAAVSHARREAELFAALQSAYEESEALTAQLAAQRARSGELERALSALRDAAPLLQRSPHPAPPAPAPECGSPKAAAAAAAAAPPAPAAEPPQRAPPRAAAAAATPRSRTGGFGAPPAPAASRKTSTMRMATLRSGRDA